MDPGSSDRWTSLQSARLSTKQPFDPFAIRLADGRSLPVPHPDFVAVTPRRVVVVAEDGACSVVEPILNVSLDDKSTKGKSGNGKTKKRRGDP
jgi:hypothetical protein